MEAQVIWQYLDVVIFVVMSAYFHVRRSKRQRLGYKQIAIDIFQCFPRRRTRSADNLLKKLSKLENPGQQIVFTLQ